MSTTTTNFGWTVPSDTDLVKDGAAAIRTALGGVDTSFVDLKGGTTGQVLSKASGTDLDYSWVTPASGGKILQVVAASSTTATTISTTTYTDTNLTATITPSASTSKILVLITQQFFCTRVATAQGLGMKLLRNGSVILSLSPNDYEALYIETTSANFRATMPLTYLDSPSTTSAVTYKTQARPYSTAASGYITAQEASAPSQIILMEVGA